MRNQFYLTLCAVLILSQVVSACSISFATSSTFSRLVGREGYTLLLAYNPQGRRVDGQLDEVLDFSAWSRGLNEAERAAYCPHVVLADGTSFDPFHERVFQKISRNIPDIDVEEKDAAVVGAVQALGVTVMPTLLLMHRGVVLEEWNPDLSRTEMFQMFRSVVDAAHDKALAAAGFLSEADALGLAIQNSNHYLSSLLLPHFTTVTASLRRDVYVSGSTIIRPSKGSAVSKVLFGDSRKANITYAYSVGRRGNVTTVPPLTEDVTEADWVPSQWSRRLNEAGLVLLRGQIQKSVNFPIGNNGTDAAVVAGLATPSVLAGVRHFAGLRAARRRSPCTVTLFIKDADDDVVDIYRQRLAKVAALPLETTQGAPGSPTLGSLCTFMVADAEINSRRFTSFGFMFKALYRSAMDLKNRASVSPLLPPSRLRFSDNLIGVEFNDRKYQFPDKTFNVPLLGDYLRKVLAYKAVRTRRCEMFSDSDFATKPSQQLIIPFADCDTLYYDALKDLRRDSLIILLPNTEARRCLTCTDGNCSWAIAEGCPSVFHKQVEALSTFFTYFLPTAAREVGVFYFTPDANDQSPFVRLPSSHNDNIQLMFIHRSDKLAYAKQYQSFQPGVHDLQAANEGTVRASVITVPAARAVDTLTTFVRESSEALSAHLEEPVVFTAEFDEDEF